MSFNINHKKFLFLRKPVTSIVTQIKNHEVSCTNLPATMIKWYKKKDFKYVKLFQVDIFTWNMNVFILDQKH